MPADPTPASTAPEKKPGIVEWYAAVVLMLVWVLSYIDRALPFILVQSIKRDLGLSDTEIGLISGLMFAFVFAVMGFPLATLIDRWKRKMVLGWAIIVWSAMTVLGGFAGTFWQFGFTRLGVATGEAAVAPATHSMIGAYFTQQYRGRAIALFLLGAPLGTLLGLLLGGWINEVANWRTALFLVGAPGAILALLVFFTLKEPPKPPATGLPPEARASVAIALKAFFSSPGLVSMLAAMILTGLSMSAFGAFTSAYLIRKFHMATSEIGFLFGLCSAAAGLIGTALGGLAADRFRRNNRAGALVVVGILLFGGAVCGLLALRSHSYAIFLAWILPMQIAGFFQGPPTIAVMQNNIPPRTYAIGGVIYLFAFSGIGGSLGPIVTGMLSDRFAGPDPAESLRIALFILVLPYFLATALFLLGGYLLRRSALRASGAPMLHPASV